MKKIVLVVATVAAALLSSTAEAALVAYWNFNGLSIATASAPGSGGVPLSIAADEGAGTIDLSPWAGLVDDFAGATLNALNADPAGASLSLVAGGPTGGPDPGNQSYISTTVSTTGLKDPIISFATRGTSTGFNASGWSYSTNGVDFTPIPNSSTATRETTFALATVDLTGVAAVADQSSVTFRYAVDGASSNSGNNRIDNLQINATAIPEPGTLALAGLGLLGVVASRRRR